MPIYMGKQELTMITITIILFCLIPTTNTYENNINYCLPVRSSKNDGV